MEGEGEGGVASIVSSSPQFSFRRGNFILLFFDEESLVESSANLFLDGDLAIPLSITFESLTSWTLLSRFLILSHVDMLS